MNRPRPVALAALAVLAVAHAAGLGIGTASAHDGEGILVIEAQGPAAGLSVPYVIRLTWANDGHPAIDSTVTATVLEPDGTPRTPVVMEPIDEDGRYAATIALGSGGSWTVRFTAVTPTATIEVVEEVAEPTTTTTAVESTTTTESTPAPAEPAAAADDPDDDDIGPGGVLAALFLGLVVLGCAVGFGRSARRLRDDR